MLSSFSDTFHAAPFAQFLDLKNGDSQKWNKYAADILPMWVADMDCQAPAPILNALQKRLQKGALGYAKPSHDFARAICRYTKTRYQWEIKSDWLVFLPGLVPGFNLAARAIEGNVLIQTPAYPPFFGAVQNTHNTQKRLISVPLILNAAENQWQIDFGAMEKAAAQGVGLFLLCHPHNPTGRAWTLNELKQLADFAKAHHLIVCSDEIHCDLILEERAHTPFAALNSDASERSITLMAPSKTYNIAGLGCSFAVIPNAQLRAKFERQIMGIVPDVNVLGLVAGQVALEECAHWHQELILYLRQNRDLVEKVIGALPNLAMTHVEATFLAWIDARQLKVKNVPQFFEQAGVGLSDGAAFGAEGFVRLNFGAHQSTLMEALTRIQKAVL